MPINENPDYIMLPAGPSSFGNKAASLTFTLAPGELASVNLSADLDRIESILVDNVDSNAEIMFVFPDTDRRLVVAPGADCCNRTFSRYPYFSVKNGNTGLTASFTMLAFSCSMPVYERFPRQYVLASEPGVANQLDYNGFGGSGPVTNTELPGNPPPAYLLNAAGVIVPFDVDNVPAGTTLISIGGNIFEETITGSTVTITTTPADGGTGSIDLGTGPFSPENSSKAVVLTNGNATMGGPGSYVNAISNFFNAKGLRYAEYTVNETGNFGVAVASSLNADGAVPGSNTSSFGWMSYGAFYFGNQPLNMNLGDTSIGRVFAIAIDFDNGDIWFRGSEGRWNENANASPVRVGGAVGPGGLNSASAWNGALTALLQSRLYMMGNIYQGSQLTLNIGQDPWFYALPSGYEAWAQI